MRKLLLTIIGGCAFFSATVFAGEPTTALDPKEAVRLISLKSNVPANAIDISFIVDGSAKCGKETCRSGAWCFTTSSGTNLSAGSWGKAVPNMAAMPFTSGAS
jgi:hypothetical protein